MVKRRFAHLSYYYIFTSASKKIFSNNKKVMTFMSYYTLNHHRILSLQIFTAHKIYDLAEKITTTYRLVIP